MLPLAALAALVAAHPAEPVRVSVTELTLGWTLEAPARLRATLPGCTHDGLWRCPQPPLSVHFAPPPSGAVACVSRRLDGWVETRVVRAPASECRFAGREARHEAASVAPLDFLGLGVHHLLTGLDHMAFVIGLFALLGASRGLFWVITAFTLGHSVTLALQVLGVVTPPAAAVELLIAASVVWVARELAQGSQREDDGARAAPARPASLALGFGLFHGLGFAGALGQPEWEGVARIPALFWFNVGLELGQLGLVLLLAAAVATSTRLGVAAALGRAASATIARVIGAAGMYWIAVRLGF